MIDHREPVSPFSEPHNGGPVRLVLTIDPASDSASQARPWRVPCLRYAPTSQGRVPARAPAREGRPLNPPPEAPPNAGRTPAPGDPYGLLPSGGGGCAGGMSGSGDLALRLRLCAALPATSDYEPLCQPAGRRRSDAPGPARSPRGDPPRRSWGILCPRSDLLGQVLNAAQRIVTQPHVVADQFNSPSPHPAGEPPHDPIQSLIRSRISEPNSRSLRHLPHPPPGCRRRRTGHRTRCPPATEASRSWSPLAATPRRP
jgi:hypothetical protein